MAQILETKNELEDDGRHEPQDGQPKKVEIVSCIYFNENIPVDCTSHKAVRILHNTVLCTTYITPVLIRTSGVVKT